MEKLVFKIDEISPEGIELELDPDPSIYGIEEIKVLYPPGLSGWIRINKEGREIVVSGEIRAGVQLSCNRCLGPASSSIEGGFSFRMVPQKEVSSSEEIELHEEEMEVEFFSGNEVDVRRIIAEQVYLNVPIKVVCRKDCRGLCSQCGRDLNKGDCGHRQDKADSRWEILRKIDLNN